MATVRKTVALPSSYDSTGCGKNSASKISVDDGTKRDWEGVVLG